MGALGGALLHPARASAESVKSSPPDHRLRMGGQDRAVIPVRRDKAPPCGTSGGTVGDEDPAQSEGLLSPYLARQILWPLLGQLARQEACGLTDLDHVAVRIAHIAADLGISIDRRRNKLGPALAPFSVAGVDVRDPQI